MLFEDKEVDLILYSILIGVALTFVSLVYYHYVSFGLFLNGGFSDEIISVRGFPIGWITSQIFGIFGVFDVGGFLFDLAFWTAVTYVTLRYTPNLIKPIQKRERA